MWLISFHFWKKNGVLHFATSAPRVTHPKHLNWVVILRTLSTEKMIGRSRKCCPGSNSEMPWLTFDFKGLNTRASSFKCFKEKLWLFFLLCLPWFRTWNYFSVVDFWDGVLLCYPDWSQTSGPKQSYCLSFSASWDYWHMFTALCRTWHSLKAPFRLKWWREIPSGQFSAGSGSGANGEGGWEQRFLQLEEITT